MRSAPGFRHDVTPILVMLDNTYGICAKHKKPIADSKGLIKWTTKKLILVFAITTPKLTPDRYQLFQPIPITPISRSWPIKVNILANISISLYMTAIRFNFENIEDNVGYQILLLQQNTSRTLHNQKQH